MASALEKSRKRSHRTIIEVNADTIFVSCGIGNTGGPWSARAQRDDVGRALWPLDARYEALGWWRLGVGTCVIVAATTVVRGCRNCLTQNRSEGFDGVNGVKWLSGVLINY